MQRRGSVQQLMIKLAFKEENKCSKKGTSGSLQCSAVIIQNTLKGLQVSEVKGKDMKRNKPFDCFTSLSQVVQS